MTPIIRATHHSSEIVIGPWTEKVPGAIGKKETKNISLRVRHKFHNEGMARVYLQEAEAGRNRFGAALRALKKNKNKLNNGFVLMSND